MYFESLSKYECCGCTACQASCPVSAISMCPDEEGFLYPRIDKGSCISCGLCERVCPVASPKYVDSEKPRVYAAILKDKNEIVKSTSGGVFYSIASWIIEQNGVVFGASMDSDLQVAHVGVRTMKDLEKLRGSKYVQSDLKGVFKQIKSCLDSGEWCYFVGTGCQVAGLYSFLRKRYDKLLTSDLVCHGVPSQWMFDQHVRFLEDKHRGAVSDYRFRDCSNGKVSEFFCVSTQGKQKTIFNPSYELSPYLYSFMYAMTYRYSCYDCKFAALPRQGDITLADYWGVEHFIENIDTAKGVSMVLINNDHGADIWEKVKDSCEYYLSDVEQGAKYNANLVRSSIEPAIRKEVYSNIRKYGYGKVARKCFRSGRYWAMKLYFICSRHKCLKPLLKFYGFIKKA